MKYNLPKGYLSYSSMDLWKKSKDNFRRKYYSTEDYDVNTAYTKFGKEIAETLEDPKATQAHPILSKIPSYATPEYPLEVEIADVPIKGYIDSFCPDNKSIIEYKTGIRTRGKAPWDHLKVKKHDQLLLYALGVKTIHGDVDPLTKLVWMETQWAEECTDTPFKDNTYRVCAPALQLTGEFKVFDREIEDWELLRLEQDIARIASEITEDYTRYQKTGDNSID